MAKAARLIGTLKARISKPSAKPMPSARSSSASTSARSPEPLACAVSPVIPMRRKPKAQKISEMIVAPSATPAKATASPVLPITAVSTSPTSGMDAWPSMIGQACAKMLARVRGLALA